MSDSPAGWHPDPRGRHEHRYWDGTQWTDHVADAGVMSTDPVAEVTPVAAPIGPSMVNLPAISPELLAGGGASAAAAQPEAAAQPAAEPEPEPQPATTAPAAEAQPTAVQEPQPAPEAQPEPEPVAAAPAGAAGRSPDLAALLSVVAPGSGHVYLGRTTSVAYGLLGATVVAIVLAYFNFFLFIVGLVIWAGAAAYGLIDLRGGLSGLRETRLSAHLVGWILVGAGAALIVSLVLPWYHVNVDVKSSLAGISASQSKNFSGFGAFTTIDIILLVVGVAAVLAGLAAVGKGPISSNELPQAMPMIVAAGGAIALVLIVYRLFVDPVPGFGSLGGAGSVDISVGRAPGALLAAAAAIAILVASVSVLTAPRATTVATA